MARCDACDHLISAHGAYTGTSTPQAITPQAPPPLLLQSSLSKVDVGDAFKDGIKYMAPDSLVGTSGKDWTFQPYLDLYEILGSNVLKHYGYYKSNNVNKTYIPSYFYLGGAGTGKSRHALEFASSVREVITLHTQHPLYPKLAQRLTKSYVFYVSLKNRTSLGPEEKSNIWNAIGIRMLHQLLSRRLAYVKRQYATDPGDIFKLVAAAANVNLYNGFTGILVVDGI